MPWRCPVNQHVRARSAGIFFNLWKSPVPLRGVRTWSQGGGKAANELGRRKSLPFWARTWARSLTLKLLLGKSGKTEILTRRFAGRAVGAGVRWGCPLLRAEGEEGGNFYSFHPRDGQDCPDNCKTQGFGPLFWGCRLQFGGGDLCFLPF